MPGGGSDGRGWRGGCGAPIWPRRARARWTRLGTNPPDTVGGEGLIPEGEKGEIEIDEGVQGRIRLIQWGRMGFNTGGG